MTKTSTLRNVVLVDGCRIPFQRSGSGYIDLMAYDLARITLQGLLNRTSLDPDDVDQVIMGTVIQEVKTSNIARDAALAAGIPETTPANTVTQACISSNQAITSGIEKIVSGQADIVIAGGAETMSDVPIRLKRKLRKKLIASQKYKTPAEYLKLLRGLRPNDILPEVPQVSEFSTGETMGQSCDKMAARFGVSREEQDAYALRSHQRAAIATRDGLLKREVVPAPIPPKFEVIRQDNGFRADSTLDKLAQLKPAFIKPHGTVTAGNSSALTDGASAVLIMSEEKAKELELKPKARFKQFTYVAQDPKEELLLGPAYATPKVLDNARINLSDIDVFELHEAFAGQVLSVLYALNSEKFAKENLNKRKKVGEIPIEKLNTLGGSLSLGHPFGATGARLVTTAANRLIKEDGNLALIAACAAGGLGHAMLLQRYK